MTTLPYHVQVIKSELDRRRSLKAGYSLRNFAKDLNLHPSLLSRVLSGKQALSPKSAEYCANRLSLAKPEKRIFLRSVIDERREHEEQRLGSKAEIPNLRLDPPILDSQATARVFNLAAHSILQLTFVENFQSEVEWIANRLSLPAEQVQSTIDSLIALGLLAWDNGRLVNTQINFSAINNKDTNQIRINHQKEILEKAIQSVESDSLDRRAHFGVTMAIDPEKLPQAREKIARFLESMNDFLETGHRREVYQIAVQLFPLDQGGKAQ